jgi:hypothetical protein
MIFWVCAFLLWFTVGISCMALIDFVPHENFKKFIYSNCESNVMLVFFVCGGLVLLVFLLFALLSLFSS